MYIYIFIVFRAIYGDIILYVAYAILLTCAILILHILILHIGDNIAILPNPSVVTIYFY